MAVQSAATGALRGTRVLDLTRILAGPFCTQILGDYGADVIKVERPVLGDDTRKWGPPFVKPMAGASSSTPEASYFLAVNRNKRSVAIDLKTREGVEIVRDLALKSDVVVENFVPGKAEELGLGFDELSKLNPRLVYASLSGYGSSGPRRDELAYDAMVSAVGGLMGMTGPRGGEPVKVGVAITDICTGLFLHGAVLAALLAREQTGRGQRIETSLLAAQVGVLANVASAYLTAGVEAQRWGTAHASIVPYQGFPTKDGHIVLGALNDGQFARACGALGVTDLVSDPRFVTNSDRVKNRDELLRLLTNVLRERTTKDWNARLVEARVPCAPINNMEGVFSDEQVRHLDLVKTVEHTSLGPIRVVGPSVAFSETPPQGTRLPPPCLGEHTAEVLREVCGYSDEKIAHLRSAKVIADLD